MSKSLPLLLFAFLLAFSSIHAQTCQDASVELTAEVQGSPPLIRLHWTANASATQHFVYRKLKGATSWGSALSSLPGSATEYTDTTVASGVSYEYRITRTASNYSGFGYINAGIEIEAVEQRGVLFLIVDSTFVDSLTFEIERLKSDLEGDGWKVIQINVSRTAPVTEVKARIIDAVQMNPAGTKAAFLLGHVPVPYSGELNPDAHPDHLGAWPADVYYADINGIWTDISINNATASDPRNRNIPGDGKFDQSILPSDVEMQIGRVDFANMPAFAASELQLLKDYLIKNHRYRHRDFAPDRKMLIDDNFGFFSAEAFAANGWKASPLVGMGNIEAGDYLTDLSTKSYLWSFGCGGGSYTSAGGIGTTQDFASSFLNSVFTMLFGSYFGDWDSQNNFLRAALAQGTTLTNAWAGRPHWMFHHMGLGETIGYCTRVSQNNSGLYFFSYGARGVHIALMGDPTLRNDIVAPVSGVIASLDGTHAMITWNASTDPVSGYHVYVRQDNTEDYVRVNQDAISGTTFVDSCLITPGIYTYMVRALMLQESASGTYYNLSQGMTGTVVNNNNLEVEASASWLSANGYVYFTNTSVNATSYHWNFGNGETSTGESPSILFGDGDYTVTLIASNGCDADTITYDISVSTATGDLVRDPDLFITPNPSSGKFSISLNDATETGIVIYNALGNLIFVDQMSNDKHEIDLSGQESGIYFLIASPGNEDRHYTARILIQK